MPLNAILPTVNAPCPSSRSLAGMNKPSTLMGAEKHCFTNTKISRLGATGANLWRYQEEYAPLLFPLKKVH